jgi:predicted nucleic acid-binding protein
VTYVLDSWAVLRLLEGTEPAASRVEAVLATQRPIISWINVGEVFYVLRRLEGEDAARTTLRDLRPAIAHGALLLTGDPELLMEGAPWRAEDLRSS